MDSRLAQQERKTRSACDRCHGQKLRCILKPGHTRCERCLRLDTVCRFAPRAPRGSIKSRSLQSQKTPNPQDVLSQLPSLDTGSGDGALDVSLDSGPWSDIADMLNQDNICQLEPTINDQALLWSPDTRPSWESDVQTLQLPSLSTSTTHELAGLSIALAELTANLPTMPEAASSNSSNCTSTSARSEMPFILDDLFRLTTQFTDLIQTRLGLSPDEATILMLGSCHSRLTDIYTTVFSLVQRCINHSPSLPRLRQNWAIVLPKVEMGSLNAPALRVDEETPASGAKAFMYMWMLCVFSAELWTQLSRALGGQDQVVDGISPLGRMVWTDMADRAGSVLQSIESTRALVM
ncbi:hypothetical protein ASPVEDRAFT_38326 [Aspergillus versicolor CBS 583.65]|uniref:Zn(2)-C6 fungal-type domain-containing protein n=1 Tax=Aspergillus versicolor CBS 583.65 TaxID=1036611 RepID=A0A1L9PBC7_ASPVE|nr:uncharacterized protein ASPVEDRAFT_38326 [Aspergillus versicolor CBS 583.65]OJI98827.1 hypothetical protein ASPVEDRAFT_38326 [Aspergillus versicolor CBS 583.65]